MIGVAQIMTFPATMEYFKNKIVEKEPHCYKYISLYSNFSCSPLLIETKFVPCIPLNSLA